MKKVFILNAGTRTQKAFVSGLTHAQVEYVKTKETILHIKHDLSCTFLYKNEALDFSHAYVFTRLRATDAYFSSLMYEHFNANGIQASDGINAYHELSEKIAQMPRLARAGISIPETIIARRESFASNRNYILKNITFPIVFKTDGSRGEAVFKVASEEELDAHIARIKPRELFLLQQHLPNTFDTRTLVAYGVVLGTIKRTAQNGNFLNNVSQGAMVEAYTLTEEERTVAIKASAACEIDFGGVDIIHTEKGPIVLEVNKSPQIKGFEQIFGKDYVFKTIAGIIEKTFL